MPPPRRRAPPRRSGALTDLPPLKIVKKIVLLQLAYYASATVLVLFTTQVYGAPFNMALILSWDSIRGDTTFGWILGLVWLLNGFITYVFFTFPLHTFFVFYYPDIRMLMLMGDG